MRGSRLSDELVDDTPQGAAEFRQVWDTAYVSPRERFAYFREAVCQTFLSVSPDEPEDKKIAARLERIPFARGSVAKLVVTPHTIARTTSDIANISSEYIEVYLQITGETVQTYGGHGVRQSAGDIVACDVNQPFVLNILPQANLCRVVLFFEKAAVTRVLGREARIGNRVLSGRPVANALFTCLSIMENRFLSGSYRELEVLYDASVSLVLADLLGDEDFLLERVGEQPSVGQGILVKIKVYISQKLENPQLSPAIVAARFNISVRYLHKLFMNNNETFGRYVLARRLQRVWADLIDPSCAHIAIADVAQRWGFNDLSSFYRNFKAQFDRTPGDVRMALLSTRRT